MKGMTRVYIVEDNPEAGMHASLLIESSGLGAPTVIEDGLEGLAACFRQPPDALVLDLELPSMPGQEILRLLRASRRHRHLPIIICSSLPDAKRRELALLRMGADAYLDKPLMDSVFLDVLGKLLGHGFRKSVSESETAEEVEPSKAFIDGVLEKELRDEPATRPRNLKRAREETETQPRPDAPTPRACDTATRKAEEPSGVYEGYKILGVVGAGGMGTVYRAEQLKLRRVVALKVLLEDYHRNLEMRDRFQREALIMAQVNHPNIVQVYEAGQTDYSSYIAMEFVDGEPLDNRIRECALNWEECPSLIRQACNAIAHLHSMKIIHRDIKPSNILVSSQGLVKVTDFGISQARLSFEVREYTEDLKFMGTPDYMAPELKRLAEANEKTDQYALGMTFWRMFAGIESHAFGRPLHELHPEIPEDLSSAIGQCIALDPRDRFASVIDARDAILEACKGTFSGTWDRYISPII